MKTNNYVNRKQHCVIRQTILKIHTEENVRATDISNPVVMCVW